MEPHACRTPVQLGLLEDFCSCKKFSSLETDFQMSRRKGEIDTNNSKTEYHDEGKQPAKVVHSHISILWLANKNQRHGHCMKKMPGLHLGNESIGSRWPKTNPERGNVQVPCARNYESQRDRRPKPNVEPEHDFLRKEPHFWGLRCSFWGNVTSQPK